MVPPGVVESAADVGVDSSLTTTKDAVEARERAKKVTGVEGLPVGRTTAPRARDVGVDPGGGPVVLEDPWCEDASAPRARGWMER